MFYKRLLIFMMAFLTAFMCLGSESVCAKSKKTQEELLLEQAMLLQVQAAAAAQAEAQLSPEVLAQQAAAEAEAARVAAEQAAQAQSDMAYALAQQAAIDKEISDIQAAWGTVPEYYNAMVSSNAASMYNAATSAPSATASQKVTIPSTLKVVDLVIFAGQSNMSGAGGSAALAPAVINGAGYEFKAITDPTGLYTVKEPFGAGQMSAIGEPAGGSYGSLVSSFINNYYKATGVPVVAVSASRGATDSAYWNSPAVKSDLLSRYIKAKSFLESKGIVVRKKYVVWLQGESDAVNGVTPERYIANVNGAFSQLFASGLNQVFVITPGYMTSNPTVFDGIIATQKSLCATNGWYTLASERLRALPATALTDTIHYNQASLNQVGADAASRAATFTATSR